MIGSAHHTLSKCLASLLEPVLKRYTAHCIPDLFTIAEYIRRLNEQNDSFMGSFDVCSLLTNISFEETINICTETFYNNADSQPYFPKEVFVELMYSATSSIEFNFDNLIYKKKRTEMD